MKLIKVTKTIAFITLLSLIYIHLQMQIYDLAYQGKFKENAIRQLLEENGSITYKILTLKSANNLGESLLQDDSQMQFGDPNDIVFVTTPEDYSISNNLAQQVESDKKTNPLLSLLSFGAQAEAGLR